MVGKTRPENVEHEVGQTLNALNALKGQKAASAPSRMGDKIQHGSGG